MSLPTTVTKSKPRAKREKATPVPMGALDRIPDDDKLSKAALAKLLGPPVEEGQKPERTAPVNTTLYQCAHNFYPTHDTWQAACEKRAVPSITCTCNQGGVS